MGSGVGYTCSKCGYEYSANTGIGFLFPTVYQEVLSDVKAGKYGEDWKKLSLNETKIAVDAETYLYICKKCSNWEVDYGLNLYAPNKSDAEEPEYVMGYELKEQYHILKRYVHKCKKCGDVMHKATVKEKGSLHCPKCGGEPSNDSVRIICWD